MHVEMHSSDRLLLGGLSLGLPLEDAASCHAALVLQPQHLVVVIAHTPAALHGLDCQG
jgi:hypothetical protein